MGTSKISDIKDTASDTVEILRQLGTPGVQETLDKARTMTITVKEIMETMKSAEWVQNLENIRKMMDDMNSSSLAMQNTVRELKESGVLDEAKSFMQSAKKTMDSFGGGGQGPGTKQDIHEVVVSFREMIDSFKLFTDELKAVAVESNGDMAGFYNCRFIGNQDVLFTNNALSRQYYENCYIEGTTDFIFGSSTVWFQQCHIHSKKNSHVTAASTPKENEFGYIFNECILTGDTSLHNVSLGRPWRPFAHVVFINCFIGEHIKPEGWSNWNDTDNFKTTRYSEYRNYGPSSDPLKRVEWAKQLTDEETKKYTIINVLNGWNPLNR